MTGVSPYGPRFRQDTSNSGQIHVSGLTPPLVPGCAECPNGLAAPGGAGFRAHPIRATFALIKTAPARETRNDATVRGHPGDRRHACAGGAVRGLPAGGAGRRRDQGRASRRARPEPRLRHRQGAQPPQHGHGVPDAGFQQALDRARPEAAGRSRGPEEAGRHRGRVRGELPPRRVRGAGARLRRARRHQPAADLCLVLGLRPARAARRPDRLRPRDPGDVGHHGDDRHQGRAPREDRRAGGRLRHRHDRRLRPVGRAVPARAHRARPAHRHGHARRGDDPDELASHRLSAQWRASQAPRQPPSPRHQRGVRDPGRPGDAGRQQSAPAAPPVDGAGAAAT